MTERATATVEVDGKIEAEKVGDHYDRESFSASEMLGWLTGRLAAVPEQFRPSARVHIDATCWENDGLEIDSAQLKYTRPETDDELSARLARDADYLRQQEARERKEYERLAKKFGKK